MIVNACRNWRIRMHRRRHRRRHRNICRSRAYGTRATSSKCFGQIHQNTRTYMRMHWHKRRLLQLMQTVTGTGTATGAYTWTGHMYMHRGRRVRTTRHPSALVKHTTTPKLTSQKCCYNCQPILAGQLPWLLVVMTARPDRGTCAFYLPDLRCFTRL